MFRFARSVPLALACAASLACQSTPASTAPDAQGGGDGASGQAGQSGESGASGDGCTAGPGYATNASPIEVAAVTATVHDASGAPVPALPVQVCGIDLCVNGNTDGSGRAEVRVQAQQTLPAFKYGAGFNPGDAFEYAHFAVPLQGRASLDLGDVTVVALPDFADSTPFGPGEIGSGPVRLEIAQGSLIEHDLLTYGGDQLGFRAAPIPLDASLPAIDASLGFESAYALGPIGTRLCPEASLNVENAPGWPAGTEVEVLLHGVEIDEEWAPYGGWAKIADARVDDTGTRIESTSGGLPIVSAIGLRRK